MELAVQEAPLLHPTGDDLLAGLRHAWRSTPSDSTLNKWVKIRLTLDEASLLYEKLRRIVERPPRPRRSLRVRNALTDPRFLLEVLSAALAKLPTTAALSVSKRGATRTRQRAFLIQVRRHERSFFRKILDNQECDELRREALEEELFAPLGDVLDTEEGIEKEELSDGIRRPFAYPIHHDNPASHMRRVFLKQALAELPTKLKMPSKEVSALISALTDVGGNVSEAARQLGQPQRKTARQVARIARHLKSRGFSS